VRAAPAPSHPARRRRWTGAAALLVALGLVLAACQTLPEGYEPPSRRLPTDQPAAIGQPGDWAHRRGDEISVNGQPIHTGAPVLLWVDPGGYNGYAGQDPRNPQNYGRRNDASGQALADDPDLLRGALRQCIDQFVLHYDGAGTSQRCFQTLQARHLSVHFLLDLDGTIYQTLDLRERAFHATTSNHRSIGVEIANIGAFPQGGPNRFADWYRRDAQGRVTITIPSTGAAGRALRTPDFVGHPARNQIITGRVQGQVLQQYDLTPQQYDSLERLTAALCLTFPKLRCDYPRGPDGQVYPAKLPDDYLARYQGILGHYHIQTNKIDPGPAMQWGTLVGAARKLMGQ
jgi:N-acetylmuramoyl-L-alanine amidase